MIKKIKEVISNEGTVYIYGCGNTGIEYYSIIKLAFPEARMVFVDGNEGKQLEGICIDNQNVPVFDPNYIKSHGTDYVIILSSDRFYREMRERLDEIGVPEHQIVMSSSCYDSQTEELTRKINRRLPRKTLNFVVDVAVHCNLNCQNCDHFSPLAAEEFTDIEQFEKDMARMAYLFGNDITHIDLEGGEPLLNKEICRFIEIVNKYFKESIIKIFTNGTLLPQMSEEFWRVCREYSVQLEVTKYPIEFNYRNAERLAQNNGVSFHIYDGGTEKTSWHKPLDLEGKQDRFDSFGNCYLANGECTMLKNGKLYPCTLIPNLAYFNSYFKCDLQVTNEDFIDIYSDVSKETIYEFLCNPPRACRYCKVREWTKGHKWGTSKKSIKEWT